ncbi:Zinc transporter zip14-like [Plakobranchus ocellatus]|uniref:Zinc transporter zip14-like n=1 Tax=Plakobranchus ocellatus TaxID=259542 RepID=A0AAV4DHY0_9GAST|nr:Zinc transporter zip14-like [Plakobranchus ocellatus]
MDGSRHISPAQSCGLLLFAAAFLSRPSVSLTLDSSALQQVFSQAVAQNVTSFSDLAIRLGLPDRLTKDQDGQETARVAGASSGYDVGCWASTAELSSCLKQDQKCISLSEMGEKFGLNMSSASTKTSSSSAAPSPAAQLSPAEVDHVAPAVIYSLLTCGSDRGTSSSKPDLDSLSKSRRHIAPSTEATWGYSLLFVTLINLCALTGAFVLPCMRLKSYKLVLIFMVALAVGTLAGSGLLFLIPEAFALVHDDDIGYIWKSTTILGGVYLFYLTERIMRMINTHRENTQAKKKRDEIATEGTITTSFRRLPVDNSIAGKDPSQIPSHLTGPGALCGSALAPHPSNNSSCVEFAALEASREDSDDGAGDVIPAGSIGTRRVKDVERAAVGNGGAHVVSFAVVFHVYVVL